MSRGDANITIWCDEPNCKENIQIELCALAMHGAWDERNVDRELKRDAWTSDGDNDFCYLHSPKVCSECGLTKDRCQPSDHEFTEE